MSDVKLLSNTIAHCVCTYYNVSLLQVKSNRRTEELVKPRWMIALVGFKEMGDPLLVGELLSRNFYAVTEIRKGAKKRLAHDEDFQNDLKIICEFVKKPETVYVKKTSKAEKAVTEKPRFERPPAIYGNRDIRYIHDEYAAIRI